MHDLTQEQLKTIVDTQKHIELVRALLHRFAFALIRRGENHDTSKASPEELDIFTIYTEKLRTTTYGSEEYNHFLAEMKPALDHHYANNRHHPQFYSNGVDGMTLIDLVEMFADWWASTQRHADGDIQRSIEYNETRFNISPQISQIFRNTVDAVDAGKPWV